MSKRNMLIGTAAGKVGDLVFYRAGGEQRTRARVVPNNPKSYAQQAQRSRIANVTLMYRALSAIMKDTFPNRPSNQTPFSAFSKEALVISPYLTKDNAEASKFIPIPTLIAKGGLPVPFSEITLNGSQEIVGKMPFEVETAGVAVTTVGQLATALINTRPCVFKEGGKIIFVHLLPLNDDNPDRYAAEYITIPLDPSSNTQLQDMQAGLVNHQSTEQTPAYSELKVGTGSDLGGFTIVVVAPKTGGGFDVTDAFMELTGSDMLAYENATTESAAKAAAISYGACEGSCVVNS